MVMHLRPSAMVTGPRVALVDDNPAVLDRVRLLLLGHFNVVGAFQDSKMLLDAWSDLMPELVVLDVSMEPVNGLDLARKLKKSGCDARVVFLTALHDEEFVRAAFAEGACAYVLKPHMANELLPALYAALLGKRFLSAALPYNI